MPPAQQYALSRYMTENCGGPSGSITRPAAPFRGCQSIDVRLPVA